MEDKPMKRWEALAFATLSAALLLVLFWPRDSDWDTHRAVVEYSKTQAP